MEEDSFFGFDTTLPAEQNGRKLEEDPEELYDALNDETFGSAINGDWEKSHEQLVKLDRNGSRNSSNSFILDDDDDDDEYDDANSDLELSLSRVRLDDVDIGTDDNESRILLDPSVWANPIKSVIDSSSISLSVPSSTSISSNAYSNPEAFIRQHFSNPFEIIPQSTNSQPHNNQIIQQQSFNFNQQPSHGHQFPPIQQNQQQNNFFGLPHSPGMVKPPQLPPKICTLEDIERNLRNQQQMKVPSPKSKTPVSFNHQQLLPSQQQQMLPTQQHQIMSPLQQQQQLLSQQQSLLPPQQQHQIMSPQQHQIMSPQQSLLPPQQQHQLISPQQQQQVQPSQQQVIPPQQQQVLPPQQQQLLAPLLQQQQQQPINVPYNQNLAQQPVSMQFNQHRNQSPSIPFNQQSGQIPHLQPAPPPMHQQHQMNGNFFGNRNGPMPPGFHPGRNNFNLPLQHPLNMMHPPNQPSNSPIPGGRAPPGFNNLPILPGNPPHAANYPRQISNLPIALNNFAMHPNFNAMRPVGPPLCPPRMPPHPSLMIQHQQQQQLLQQPPNVNQFNQRLLQEIQLNHPMLPNRAILSQLAQTQMHNNQQQQQFQMLNQQQRLHQEMFNSINKNNSNNNNNNNNNNNINNNNNNNNNDQQNQRSNGNLPNEYDEYANLMSTRDKHWLIGIQLSQLNTDTPFIDDYYYTIFKGRKAKLIGDSGQSRTHKDNQLNHPFSQPKGHAQLVLIQMGNKNGTQRNGQNNSERRNSETHSNNQNHKDQQQQQQQQQQQRHTPLQFENSLGKLQYGSVTAPRKIIDMDIMGNESNSQLNSSLEKSTKRKSRYILSHIETLYRLVLKLEDLENPAAIATALVLKERKEKEKELALLEQKQLNELGDGDGIKKSESTETLDNSSIDKYATYELESEESLLAKLMPSLTLDKIIGIMTVRKGKTLIRRLLPHIENHEIRWTVWLGVFSSLQVVLKKDKFDKEGVLFSLYPAFQKQIKEANLETIIKFCNVMPIDDKKLNGFFSSKFCISALVALILRSEEIYSTNTDDNDDNDDNNNIKLQWAEFLQNLSTTINRTIETQTISASIESTSIKPMIEHLTRFKNLKLDSLQALFSQATQVN